MILMKVAAKRAGIARTSIQRSLERAGVDLVDTRDPDSGQKAKAVSPEDFDLFLSQRSRQVDNGTDDNAPETDHLYIIQIEPAAMPRRYKIGISHDPAQSLAKCKRYNPRPIIVQTWPCERRWEQTAIDALLNDECVSRIDSEIFDCSDLAIIRQRAQKFFALLE
ncbi:MAG: hypothetical protein OXF56_24790 [Rhodobacteraceae bacterium]|nr:hypothetical protein [Paracoccaceae bacterium]